MLKRLLALDGVQVIAKFRDDGAFVEGYGMLPEQHMIGLAKFAHDYKRMTQGNADQLSMFTQKKGWTPPKGWVVHGANMAVCSVGNLVCIIDPSGNLNDVMKELGEAATY